MPTKFLTLFASLWLVCTSASADSLAEADALLERFHQAAAQADFATYDAAMAEDVVFLGTDATERWQGQAFRDFAKPYFDAGKGWTYVPTQRSLDPLPGGQAILFDELLDNEKLGQCRGSGVLIKEGGQWVVAQYNLSVPIPNELVVDVAKGIRAAASGVPVAVEVVTPAAEVETVAPVTAVEESPAAEAERKNCGRRFKTNKRADC